MNENLTLAQRRERGETIVDRRGVELVHGRVIAREALADYQALIEEHNHVYRTVSPYRSDYREITSAIDADLLEKGADLASAIEHWLNDEEWEIQQRDHAIAREAERNSDG